MWDETNDVFDFNKGLTTLGNVGIGTTNPGGYRLNVSKGSAGNIAQITDGIAQTFIFRSDSNTLYAGNANNFSLAFVTNNTEKMTIDSSGNVGIGTSDQIGEKLTVNGSMQVLGNNDPNYSAKFISAYDSTHGLRITTRLNDVTESEVLGVFADSGGASPRLVLNPTNGWKVGIGTTNPLNPLHIKQSNSSHLFALETSYANDRTGRGQISWRDSGNITGGIWTEYDGTNVSMRFGNLYSSGYNTNTSMIIRGNGNVGIGTNSPQGKFVISNSGAGGFEFEPDTTTFSVANTNYIASYDRSASAYRDIVVDLGGAESQAVRFKAGGNVGIGTSSPVAKLDIRMSDSNGAYGRGRDGNLNLENTNTSVTEGGWLSISGYMGNTANSGQYQMGAITGGKQTTAGDGDYGGYLTLWTTSSGANGEANSGAYERMRIDSSGRVGIGNNNPQHPLHFGERSQYYISLDSGNSTPGGNLPWLGLFNNQSIASATYGWGFYDSDADGSFQIWNRNGNTTGYNAFTIKRGGNVGIGTNDPTEILQLEGNTVAGGNNYIHIRKTDQGAGQGIFIGQPTNDNNLVISNKANNDIVFKTQSDETERMRIDSSGIKLPHDHFYSQEISHHGHNNFPTSYSASSAYTYSYNTNRYAYGPTGEKLVANVTARAFTNYIHLKTNLIANNIMFYVRTKGYFYSYGVEEILMGGYTYNNTQVLNKSFETIAGGTHNGGNNDLYRASSGGNLIIKIQLGHTGYTEGQMVVLFHSHGMDSSVMRDFRIIEVKTQNDGTNPY